jgi:hypothetical protein
VRAAAGQDFVVSKNIPKSRRQRLLKGTIFLEFVYSRKIIVEMGDQKRTGGPSLGYAWSTRFLFVALIEEDRPA